MITLVSLIECGVAPNIARVFAEPLAHACERFSITSREQQAGFIAQTMWESQKYATLEERLSYRTTLAITSAFKRLRNMPLSDLRALTRNPKGLALAAYSGINGNGDASTMDGWVYRGRGPIMITGLGNYQALQDATGQPVVEQPDLLAAYTDAAAQSAGWFWSTNGCNELMDHGDFDGTTRRVNGPAMLHAIERAQLYQHVRDALG